MYCVLSRDTKTEAMLQILCRGKAGTQNLLASHGQIPDPLCPNSRNAEFLESWPRSCWFTCSCERSALLHMRPEGSGRWDTESSHKRGFRWRDSVSNVHKDRSRNRHPRECFSFSHLNHRMILSLSTIPFIVLHAPSDFCTWTENLTDTHISTLKSGC